MERITGWRASEARSVVDDDPLNIASQHQVTGDVIDEAVDNVFKRLNVESSTAEAVRSLLSTDMTTGVAHTYFNGLASAALQRSHVLAARKPLVIPYLLNDTQVATLASYAVDFNLKFVSRESHDHPVAAASRMVDRALVESRVPPGVRYADIGGAVLPHINSGALGKTVHVCRPLHDRKDGARRTLDNLRAKRVASSSDSGEEQKRAARAYLSMDPAAVCGKVAQECVFPTKVATSIHVYDIPMEDWPYIMHARGLALVEGCLLFSSKIFEANSGVFEAAGARYEVDASNQTFKMGFVDSPSWWYEHSLRDYARYGVDQLIQSSVGACSYKIVERRGDTVFFRILRVPSQSAVARPVYKSPGVPMVEVHGFDVAQRKAAGVAGMQRARYVWPRPLWEAMVSHAVLLAERGTLTNERMYNHYRTVAPRQTINAVLVFGGYTVSQVELLPLVVNSSLAGLAECSKMRAEIAAATDAVMHRRSRMTEYAIVKVASLFLESLKLVLTVPVYPFVLLGQAIDSAARGLLSSKLVEWSPLVAFKDVPLDVVLDASGGGLVSLSSDFQSDFVDVYDEAAAQDPLVGAFDDPELAAALLASMGDVLPGELRERMQESAAKAVPSTGAKAGGVTSVHSGSSVVDTGETLVASTPASSVTGSVGVKARRDAVLEAITEAELEQGKIAAFCSTAVSDLTRAGEPILEALVKRREEFKNPEFWWFQGGVLARSAFGDGPESFTKAAVYLLRPLSGSSQYLCPVFTEEYKGVENGVPFFREHVRISDSSYNGWAFTLDSLEVYNGPEIVATLRHALQVGNFEFEVVLEQGPPGCGKTTSVVSSMRPGDYVMSPARKSCNDTKKKILEMYPVEADVRAARVRTLDSYLVNYGIQSKIRGAHAKRLLADEVFMSRSGKWCAAAALLGVQVVFAFGDSQQIPHVPRVETPKMHLVLPPDRVTPVWCSYRCPSTAVACWGGMYDWRVRSFSGKRGTMRMVQGSRGMEVPDNCVMMGMYQADKKALRNMYANCGKKIRVMTVHESQGETFRDVWLHRFDNRRRTDKFSLYDKPPYVLVAMSRHTDSFVYVSPPVGDLVSQWIERGKSERRVLAASEVETVGVSKEFA